mmetsp:Transcript_5104/g.5904  ORF Transcript_5104/g.5904 Transcript_5104/m.5904 type:complete len:678 (+) Transcript_5104:77-2110(+)
MAEEAAVVPLDGEALGEDGYPLAEGRPFWWRADFVHISSRPKTSIDNFSFEQKPTVGRMIDTVLKPRVPQYDENGEEDVFQFFETGMWVEYRGNDMKWKLGVVNRVVRQAPDDWDFDEDGAEVPEYRINFYYNVGKEGLVEKDNIRAPAEALQTVFGMRPWLWQQFTLLQLEKRLRFDADHEDDFDEIDNLRYAKLRWDAWLNDFQNKDFKDLYDKQPKIAQELLQGHILTPFDTIDIVTERLEEWDYDDEDISVYTYLAVLGSGVSMTVITMSIQLITPLLLLYNNMLQSDGEPSGRFFLDSNTSEPANGNFLPATDWDQFCSGEGRPEGKILITLVLIIYASSVVPDSLLSFFRVSGGSNTTYSRINSLRQIIWEQNDDTIMQQIGYKVDRLMNTGYICLLYSIMLFILLNTPLILDIILNALAIEFIHQIDENLADADWWDEGNRWIRAGTAELVIQGVLRLEVLKNPARLCKHFDINADDYKNALGSKSLCNLAVAKRDERNEFYLSEKEWIFRKNADAAKRMNNDYALSEFQKPNVQFGYFAGLLAWLGIRKAGVFNRYRAYRTWSRWEKVLFLPRVPDHIDDYSKRDTLNRQKIKGTATEIGEYVEFAYHVYAVLTGQDMIASVKLSIEHGHVEQVPIRILFGIVEMFFYLAQVCFPFFIGLLFIIIPVCY